MLYRYWRLSTVVAQYPDTYEAKTQEIAKQLAGGDPGEKTLIVGSVTRPNAFR
jgi:hypothetical protein